MTKQGIREKSKAKHKDGRSLNASLLIGPKSEDSNVIGHTAEEPANSFHINSDRFSQIAWLNNTRLQNAQRQSITIELGHLYGNQYLQRLFRSFGPAASDSHTIQAQSKYPADVSIQRKIMVAGPSELYGTHLSGTWNELSRRQRQMFLRRNREEFFVYNRPRLRLARHILADMADASNELMFSDEHELLTEVKKRLVTAYMMRISQGVPVHGKWLWAFSYPNRRATRNCGPRVNEAALDYWGQMQGSEDDDYYFELSPTGRANAYEALQALFVLQRDPCKRTLIHCDYLTSVLHYKAFAETLGREEFNRRVANSDVPLVLKWNGFDDIIAGTAPSTRAISLQEMRINRREDLIIGDHVVFFNHPMYDALIKGVDGVWRLENAILVDRQGGTDLFQGHGYTRPVPERRMKQSMLRQITKIVHRVKALIRHTKHGSHRERERARVELNRYENVHKVGNEYRVIGTAFEDSFNIPVDTPLRIPSMEELPGLRDPNDLSQFYWVKRPVESE